MRIAAEVRKVIEGQTPGEVAASAAEVHTWTINLTISVGVCVMFSTLCTIKDLLRVT